MSHNVYADMGYPDPAGMLQKAALVVELLSLMERQRLSTSRAAKRMGIPTVRLENIVRGRFRDESIDELEGCIKKLKESKRPVLPLRPRIL